MKMSAQSIKTVGGQSGSLATMVAALKPGDSLAAQVLARAPDGQALIALAGKQVHLQLPSSLQPGTLLTLTVQQGSNGLQFLVEPQTGSTQSQTLAQTQATTASTASTSGQSAASTQTATGAPSQAGATVNTATSTISAGSSPLPPVVNARTGIPVPAPLGATQGQVLTASVVSTPTAGTTVIAFAGQELPISLPTPASQGAVLSLVVQRGPDGLQLAHAPQTTTPGAPTAQGAAPGQAAGQTPTATAPAQTLAASGSAASPNAETAANPVAAAAAAPAAILAQATLASLGNQNSVTALLASVLKLGDRFRELPDNVQRAIQRFSANILPLDDGAPDAQALQTAIARSGVFLESQLASGAGKTTLDADLKSILLLLRQTLGDWLGPATKPQALANKPPPPPQQGATPRAPLPAPSAPLLDDMPITDLGKSLLSQTDAALSRLRLGQIASLPDRPEALANARQEVHLELPITIGQQPGSLSLVITRDDEDDESGQKNPSWRVQFAINASVIGEVGAEIGLLAGRTNVVLSAAETDTANALSETLDELSDALEAVGLTPGILRVRRIGETGQPSAFPTAPSMPAASGHYLDRDT